MLYSLQKVLVRSNPQLHWASRNPVLDCTHNRQDEQSSVVWGMPGEAVKRGTLTK